MNEHDILLANVIAMRGDLGRLEAKLDAQIDILHGRTGLVRRLALIEQHHHVRLGKMGLLSTLFGLVGSVLLAAFSALLQK